MKKMSLDDQRVWLVGGALLALIAAAIGWLFFIHPKMSSAAALRTQTTNTDLQNSALSGQVADLKRQSEHLGSQRAALTKLLKQLPPDNALTTYTRQVTALAQAEKVTIANLTFGTPAAAGGASSSAPVDESSTSGSTESTAPSTSATTEPEAAPSTSAAPAQTATAVTMQAQGSTQHLNGFLRALQHGPRASLIGSVQMTGGTQAASTMSLTVNIFSAPMSATQVRQLNKLFDQNTN